MVAAAFAKGDFSAPETIHGPEMPGLAALKAAQPGDLEVHYQPLSNGGQITYSTSLPTLVAAIHQWFDAQLRDHASHAMPGHAPQHHPPTPAEP